MGNSDVPGLETFLAGSIMVLASMRRRRETSTRHLPVLVASHNQKCSGFGSAAKNRRSVRHPMQRETLVRPVTTRPERKGMASCVDENRLGHINLNKN